MRTSTTSPRLIVRSLSAALAATLLAVGGLALASPASAHDELVSTDPAADSTVDILPAHLTLTFSEAIDPTEGATEMLVTDAAGTTLAAGAPTVEDNVLTQPLEGAASGLVTVLWKVVSSDGHPTSGEFTFTVTPAATPTPEPTESATPTPTPSPEETSTPSPTAVPDEDEDASSDAWPWIIGGLIVAAIGGAVVYLLVSRARQQRELEERRAGSEPPADR